MFAAGVVVGFTRTSTTVMWWMHLSGWVAIVAAAFHAVRMWQLDLRLQALRRPGNPHSAYLMVPFRWRRRLYREEAAPLITQAWQAVALMYAFGVLGAVLIARR
ncbi:MAG TPA: hypothetical protein VN607_12255 [Gemmatimonadaceae bacterium]|nr:hypothetical protein [Gemmatimonadaceae bacterium]